MAQETGEGGAGEDMTMANKIFRVALACVASAEEAAWVLRRRQHCEQFRAALKRALVLERPVVIFGDRRCSEGKRSLGYEFSVVYPVVFPGMQGVVPMCESTGPRDLAEFPDDSAVVLVQGVLEVAPDPDVILAELRRIAGSNLFFGAQLQPWTLTAAAFARRTGSATDPKPVRTAQRVGALGLLAAIVLGALGPSPSRRAT